MSRRTSSSSSFAPSSGGDILTELLAKLTEAQQSSDDKMAAIAERMETMQETIKDLTQSSTSPTKASQHLLALNKNKPFHTFLKPCPFDFVERQKWISRTIASLSSM